MTIDNHNGSNATDSAQAGGVDMSGPDSPHFKVESVSETTPDSTDVAAWEEVAEGRFMPRRVRGSYQGRALGWTFTVPSSGSDEKQ